MPRFATALLLPYPHLSFLHSSLNRRRLAVYSISDLAKLSGIKAHTIRVWESRYGIIVPQRTATNIRYYQDEDLKRLLNIALLNKNGIKISKIARMSEQEISSKVGAISDLDQAHETQLDALTLSMIEMDEYKFDRILETGIAEKGFERAMIEIIYPFLDKLSLLWLTGSVNPAQENFISYLIRQKLIVAIDRLPLVRNTHRPKILLYLPEGEFQELSLLFTLYLMRARQLRAIYLGADTSRSDLADVYRLHQPAYFFTMLSENFTREPVVNYTDELLRTFPGAHLLVSGYQVAAQRLASSERVTVLSSLAQTVAFLDRL